MNKKIFYNASLPRAGSTLLQNVMMQNPEIYSTPTSGIIEFLLNARTIYTTGDAFKAQDAETMKNGFKGFCKYGLQGFFEGITERPYVMEKSRGWLGHYDFLEFFNEEKPKIICMVRDKDILFIRFEDFTIDPETEIKRVYNYLELPYFQHDFNNVEQLTQENDIIHGMFGDHKIQPQIKPVKDDYIEILGQEQSDRLKQHYDWYFKAFNYI